MKRSLTTAFLFSVLIITCAASLAQTNGALVVKGQDLGNTSATLRIVKGGLLKDSMYSIPIKNGSFYALLPLDTGVQTVVVLIGTKPILFYTNQGDVLDITCDLKSSRVLTVTGQNDAATKWFNYDASLNALQRRDSIFRYVVDKAATEEEKYQLCSAAYTKELNEILGRQQLLGKRLQLYINELYFSYADKMCHYHQLCDIDKLVQQPLSGAAPGPGYYKALSRPWFQQSPAYRAYLFNAVRFKPIDSNDMQLIQNFGGDMRKLTPWKEYNKAKDIPDPYISDWFKAKSIVFSLRHYDMEQAAAVRDVFIKETGNDTFKQMVNTLATGYVRLNKGIAAPAISLKNEKDRTVSLSDFAGKVVYLVFWGVHCGPCIADFKKPLPVFRDQYKDIVILNVCIEGTKEQWKKAIADYAIKDVNVYDGYGKTTGDYNISSVPLHVLIDKQGKIDTYNAPGPGELLNNDEHLKALIKQ